MQWSSSAREIQGRCEGDAGEIRGRYEGDAGEVYRLLRVVGAVVELGEGKLLPAAAAAQEGGQAPHLLGLGLGSGPTPAQGEGCG